MTEEPTMATAEEAAQRVYAKRLAANRESMKRKRAEESKEQQGYRLEAKERKTAQLDEDPPGQACVSKRNHQKKTCRGITRAT